MCPTPVFQSRVVTDTHAWGWQSEELQPRWQLHNKTTRNTCSRCTGRYTRGQFAEWHSAGHEGTATIHNKCIQVNGQGQAADL